MGTPAWVMQLAAEVASTVRATDAPAPLGCHVFRNDELALWEVTLFASSTETVGGPLDGRITPANFHLDLRALQDLFEEVTVVGWQAQPMGEDDELGPHISLEGTYVGNDVWLRILAQAPARFGPGRYVHVLESRIENAW